MDAKGAVGPLLHERLETLQEVPLLLVTLKVPPNGQHINKYQLPLPVKLGS